MNQWNIKIGNSYSKVEIGQLASESTLVNQTKFSPGLFRCKNSETIVLFVDLDKKTKEEKFKFNDYFDDDLFHWDSQPQQNIASPTIKAILDQSKQVLLFARIYSSVKGVTQPFVYCGRLEFLEFDPNTANPVHITFKAIDFQSGKSISLDEIYNWSSAQQPKLARPLIRKKQVTSVVTAVTPSQPELLPFSNNELLSSQIETGTEREALVKIRVKQGLFRKLLVERYNSKCCFTGISNPSILIASHIKPFSESNDFERVDPNNGFLLAAHIDALFDSSLISFYNDGTIIISDKLSLQDRKILNLSLGMKLRVQLTEANKEFLRLHRGTLK